MDFKTSILVFSLLVGCFALPAPEDDLSQFFYEDPNTRIVGGTQAAAGSHPHMVAMTTGLLIRSFFCGGSLVSRRTVLTAAHCVDGVFGSGSLTKYLRVNVGTNRWNSGGTPYQLARNVTHPHYVRRTLKNDISLLITTTDVVLTNLVQIIPLNFQFVPANVQVRLAGWGRTRRGGYISANLLEMTATTLDGDDCVRRVAQASIDLNQPYAPPVEPHIELCTFHRAGVGACHGDSGSALVNVNNRQQVGVVSWGFPCALGAPDMFARVSAFQGWLNSNIV